jgi:predicted SAM-dependent methyltransferase
MHNLEKLMEKFSKIHLGCGSKTPSNWLNVDGSWNAWLSQHATIRQIINLLKIVPKCQIEINWAQNIYIYDIRKPLPFETNSFVAVYASHLLEHIYLTEAKSLLKECFRVLKSQGVLRMVVPDLKAIINEYITGVESIKLPLMDDIKTRADILNRKLYYRYPFPTKGSIFYKIYTALTDFHLHKWSYDADSLIYWAGFQNVKEMGPFESRIEGIEEVESLDRIINGMGICIEGIKP